MRFLLGPWMKLHVLGAMGSDGTLDSWPGPCGALLGFVGLVEVILGS